MQQAVLRFFCLAALVAVGAGPASAQTHAGQYEQADIEYGARLYASHCIACHGENGDLMPQINLRSGQFPNAPTDRELGNLIRDGLPGTAMIPNAYSPSEITALVAYVRNFDNLDFDNARLGDPVRGKAIYDGPGGCDSCHRDGARGPRSAPDLSAIGARRTAATLERLFDGDNSAILPINRPVRIVTSGGETIRGRRLNEDTFTVQIVDANERLRSFDKAALREFTVLSTPTLPAHGAALSEAQRADLVAYLLNLKGARQ